MVPPVHKVRSESRSAFSSLTRPPDSEARAKAVELNRKLDALDQRAEERKAAAGECFGGKAAEGYARTKQLIADQRKDTAEGVENTLARNDALEAERVAFERWRAENQNLLMRDLGDVKLEVVRIAKRDFFGRPRAQHGRHRRGHQYDDQQDSEAEEPEGLGLPARLGRRGHVLRRRGPQRLLRQRVQLTSIRVQNFEPF
jgi:hypothetical protein